MYIGSFRFSDAFTKSIIVVINQCYCGCERHHGIHSFELISGCSCASVLERHIAIMQFSSASMRITWKVNNLLLLALVYNGQVL
jgi:hypothetical protein